MAGYRKRHDSLRLDADYLAWGVWLTVPDATRLTADQLAAAGAFASGNDVFQVRAELTGTRDV